MIRDLELCGALGFAHGATGSDFPARETRKRLAVLLDWPAPLVSVAHIAAYFDGVLDGLECASLFSR